ncbi:MAG: ABC transporter permease [Candidatus Hermodarchaeota archaeon]
MNTTKIIKNNLIQIFAITEKNLRLKLRFKISLLITFLSPIISVLMPLIVLGEFFEYNIKFGPWNETNYLVYTFMAYNIIVLRQIILEYPSQLNMEKFWKTIAGVVIAPFNRFNLLFGIFIAQLLISLFPLIVFTVICYIYYPISFLTLLFVILLYFLIALIFSSIGLIMGVFAISNENIWRTLVYIVNIIIWLSCITYPYEIFPNIIQDIINLNPLYYIFNFVRLSWIENNIIVTISLHGFDFLISISTGIILPCIGVYIFNIIYKKYGIVGY